MMHLPVDKIAHNKNIVNMNRTSHKVKIEEILMIMGRTFSQVTDYDIMNLIKWDLELDVADGSSNLACDLVL